MITIHDRNIPATSDSELNVRVEHADIDSYGIVHFSRYAALLETATLELLAGKGISLTRLDSEGLELRVRELSIKYRKPAFLSDVLSLKARVARKTAATLTIEVSAARETVEEESQPIVTGTLNMVFVRSENNSPVEIPQTVLDLL